jgi:hypothetical protein
MLRQDLAEAGCGDSGSFVTVGRSLIAIHDWTFLLGPGFIVGVGNGLILGYLMYRGMAILGLIAGPRCALVDRPDPLPISPRRCSQLTTRSSIDPINLSASEGTTNARA